MSLERASKLGCNTVQIFSHNPRGWALKELSDKEVSLFKSHRTKFDISPVYIHASYLINIASADKALRNKSLDMLVSEMKRADAVEADYVILHTGTASDKDVVSARKRAIGALNEVSNKGNWRSSLLIENTANETGGVSSTIKDLAEIINGVSQYFIAGICIDTCHAFAAGYDIRDRRKLKTLFYEIEKYIGFDKIKLIHLNDSKGEAGSCIDRHEHIGRGKIGIEGLRQFINYKHFKNIPLILETPKRKETDDIMNLRIVREMINLE